MAQSADSAYEALEKHAKEAEHEPGFYHDFREFYLSVGKSLDKNCGWLHQTAQLVEPVLLAEMELYDSALGTIFKALNPGNIPLHASSLHRAAVRSKECNQTEDHLYFLKREAKFCRDFMGKDSTARAQAVQELGEARRKK